MRCLRTGKVKSVPRQPNNRKTNIVGSRSAWSEFLISETVSAQTDKQQLFGPLRWTWKYDTLGNNYVFLALSTSSKDV